MLFLAATYMAVAAHEAWLDAEERVASFLAAWATITLLFAVAAFVRALCFGQS